MIVRKAFILLLMIATNCCLAQDIVFARKTVETLTSSHFWGRGYTKDGMKKASRYLAKQFQSYGLKPLNGKSFFQDFSYPVNTFPDEMEVKLDGQKLTAGIDFIVSPESSGKKVKGKLTKRDSVTYTDPVNKIALLIKDKLTWSVADKQLDHTVIHLDKKRVSSSPSLIELNIENKVVTNFIASNVCALVRGTRNPDSIIVVSAHYDHIGGMGKKTYFPGANDNASGISLLLGLAKYYAANPQPYSIAFILFAGEEAGLLGSKYFIDNPLIPLNRIRFLINVDMVGTGDEGITVVNGLIYPQEYSSLTKLNDENKYLVKINARGKAANSDHYWFSERGVPAFFIYTMGGIKAYHDVFDKADTLPLNEYHDLFSLITKFNEKLMK